MYELVIILLRLLLVPIATAAGEMFAAKIREVFKRWKSKKKNG